MLAEAHGGDPSETGVVCPACGARNSSFNPRCARCAAVLPSESGVPSVPSRAEQGTTTQSESFGAADTLPDEEPTSPRPPLRAFPPREIDEYLLLRLLGQGGMGQVWLAKDRLLERLVTVKLIAAEVPSPGARAQFFVEARAVARLSHPNVVAVHRVGEVSGAPFIVSEYVRGTTLSQVDKPVGFGRALAIGVDLARGLSAAHRRGVLHRDIKPANAIAADDGAVKLLDFGVADLLPDHPVAVARDAADDGAAPVGTEEETAATLGASRAHARRGGLVGTPRYMAPEVWRGEPATAATDVYSMGVLLYELCTGSPPHLASSLEDLSVMVQERDAPPLARSAPDVPAAFAAVVDRCLLRDPAGRFADGDALREALERLAAQGVAAAAIPEGSPYRGLLAFDAEHRGLFFGRSAEVRSILDRLRAAPFVLVAGDSGTGKSSLCHAGVLPAVDVGGLGEPYASVTVILGRHPLASLAAGLAPLLGRDEADVIAELRTEPSAIARALRRRREPLLLFVDQLEELCSLAAPAEASAAAEALHAIADRRSGARLLATARGDFLTRLSSLPGLGDDLSGALFLLQPLAGARLREAIVGPAGVKGFVFESEQMVETLVEDATGAGGGLPLLQFALAELWEARDEARRAIPARALDAIGGVSGALARHADGVLLSLPPPTRDAVRAILLRLVTGQGGETVRARRTEEELLQAPHGSSSTRAALDALVRGRLLVASRADDEGTAYTLAHEALLAGWGTLREWLSRDAEARVVRQRLERAAAEWERVSRAEEALWGDLQLAEAAALDGAELGPREAAFLAASRRAVRRRRIVRWAAALSVPLAIGLSVIGMRAQAARALSLRVAEAGSALQVVSGARVRLQDQRRAAFERFDAGDAEAAEKLWAEVLDQTAAVEKAYADACGALELVLREDPGLRGARALLGDGLLARAELAGSDGRFGSRDELLRRLEVEGDATHRARASAPARLSIQTTPNGASVSILRVTTQGHRRIAQAEPIHAAGTLAPGSVIVVLGAPGHAEVRVPLLLSPGEEAPVSVVLPRAAAVPPGFVYVPPGRFLVGSADGEDARAFFGGPPMHPAETEGYLVARDETTHGEWMEFLRALPDEERRQRAPNARQQGFVVKLEEREGASFQLTMGPEDHPYVARAGEPIRYPGRLRRATQDWRRFPVSGVSFDDAIAYAAWLDRTRRVPGARTCTEREWERAARGADGRSFPGGDRLAPDDANHDVTYERKLDGFGPDEVGSHPASDSPFGLHDLAGNVWEWTSFTRGGARVPVVRGGSFFQRSLDSRSENREPTNAEFRNPFVGVRICAAPPPP